MSSGCRTDAFQARTLRSLRPLLRATARILPGQHRAAGPHGPGDGHAHYPPGGEQREQGVSQRFVVSMLGQNLPHEARFFKAALDGTTAIIMTQVADEDAKAAEPGFAAGAGHPALPRWQALKTGCAQYQTPRLKRWGNLLFAPSHRGGCVLTHGLKGLVCAQGTPVPAGFDPACFLQAVRTGPLTSEQ